MKVSIDIGTNTTRLLIVETQPDRSLSPVVMRDRVTRLGAGFDKNGNLSRTAMQRVIDVILDYKTEFETYNPDKVVLMATSATRDAANRDEFISEITRQTGHTPRILTGDQEAKYSYLGAVSDFNVNDSVLVVDAGGGSTECIYSENNKIKFAKSINIGSRRLTTRFIHHDPVLATELADMTMLIKKTIKAELPQLAPDTCIFVDGTAATLTLIDKELDYRNGRQAHHHILKKQTIENILNRLRVTTMNERHGITGLEPDRSDVITTGAVLMLELLSFFGLSEVRISLKDLMYGVLLET